MEKLKALGYSDEDLDPRFDDKSWKWKPLIDQIRFLSERGSSLTSQSFICADILTEIHSVAEHQTAA